MRIYLTGAVLLLIAATAAYQPGTRSIDQLLPCIQLQAMETPCFNDDWRHWGCRGNVRINNADTKNGSLQPTSVKDSIRALVAALPQFARRS